jgi:ABC-2 type transport system ATP-binding protein
MIKPHAPCAIEIRGLSKRFDRPAVDGLDLTVRAGELYALLGPNGAGKTTALRMLAGLLKPDAGSICVLGTGKAGHGLDLRRADDLRQAHPVGVS